MMKHYFLRSIQFFLLLSPIYILAQDKSYVQQPSLGVHLVLNGFSYKDSLNPLKAQNRSHLGLAINYLQGFTPHTDLNITFAGSFLDYPGKAQNSDNKHLLIEADASIREKLYPASRHFNPFLQAGAGVSNFMGSYGVFVPAGMGLQVSLPGETFLLFHAQYRIPLTTGQAGHFYFSAGIAGIISSRHRRASAKKGPISPTAAPTALVSSSKDSDGDGIPDAIDKCPTVAGIADFQGCPPPHRARPVKVSDDLREKMDRAAKLIFFATDSAILLPESFRSLDEVVLILQQDTLLRLDIGGHTDNSGSYEKNQRLSQQRANAVRDYLVIKGQIDVSRLSATGYGSSRPIADNTTVKGRAKNRRVQFELNYR